MEMESNLEVNSTPVEATPSSDTASTPPERMFTQSEVNELAGKIRSEAKKQQPLNQGQAYNQQAQYSSQNTGSPLNESEFRRIAAEEFARHREEAMADMRSKQETEYAQRIVDSFWNKVSTGKEKYDDFDKVTGAIDLQSFPNSVQILAEHLDNSDEVLYELGKNAFKLEQLESLAARSPKMAIAEAKRLAESIKANQSAGTYRQPNTPLSQQRPSNVGTDSGEALSMAELKRKYRA